MPKHPVKGTVQKVFELPTDLVQQFEAFRRSRGVHATMKSELMEAMGRHMAYPPPPPPPPDVRPPAPLGDSPAAGQGGVGKPAAKGKGKSKGKG